MKRNITLIAAIICAFSLCANPSVFATYSENNTPQDAGRIDSDIYQMVADYYDGVFVERNDSTIDTSYFFTSDSNIASALSNSGLEIHTLYDTKQLAPGLYAATRVILAQEMQDTTRGVILFNRIKYQEASYSTEANRYVMLVEINGGVVANNGDYWCEYLWLTYDVHGDAWDASGNRLGYKGKAPDYGGSVNAPKVGTTYKINGPSDYYYNVATLGTAIVGKTKGRISYRLTSVGEYLEVLCGIADY